MVRPTADLERVRVIFICSPSAAMFDMWMPIIHSLRSKLTDAEFLLLFPEARQVGVLDLNERLLSLGDQIFDKVIYATVAGEWKRATNMAEAQTAHERESLVRIWRAATRSPLFNLLRVPIRILLKSLKKDRQRRTSSPDRKVLPELGGGRAVVLFNVYEFGKPYMADVAREINDESPKFSLYHGVRLESHSPHRGKIGRKPKPPNTTALLFSSSEISEYRKKFGFQEAELRVTGIPRHQQTWIDHLYSLEPESSELPSRFIFIVSRPSDDDPSFTRARKLASLKNVKIAAERHGLKVVIKLHPKEEKDDGTAADAFGLEFLGKTWFYSRDHPLVLGKKCEFAVSFLSSVAVDLARIGVPVIEHLDLTVTSSAENYSQGEGNKTAGSIFARLGFALAADNSEEFQNEVDKVIADRKAQTQRAADAYHAFFPQSENVIEKISDEIISKLDPDYLETSQHAAPDHPMVNFDDLR